MHRAVHLFWRWGLQQFGDAAKWKQRFWGGGLRIDKSISSVQFMFIMFQFLWTMHIVGFYADWNILFNQIYWLPNNYSPKIYTDANVFFVLLRFSVLKNERFNLYFCKAFWNFLFAEIISWALGKTVLIEYLSRN